MVTGMVRGRYALGRKHSATDYLPPVCGASQLSVTLSIITDGLMRGLLN
jgi:hypothetical protein